MVIPAELSLRESLIVKISKINCLSTTTPFARQRPFNHLKSMKSQTSRSTWTCNELSRWQNKRPVIRSIPEFCAGIIRKTLLRVKHISNGVGFYEIPDKGWINTKFSCVRIIICIPYIVFYGLNCAYFHHIVVKSFTITMKKGFSLLFYKAGYI